MAASAARRRIIARRTFHTAKGERVVAVLCQPVMIGAEEWRCDFRISGLPQEIRDTGKGEDALESIIIAVQGIRYHLERASVALRWGDGAAGELGLPRPIPDGYGVDVEEHLTKLVRDEVTRLVQRKVRSRRKRG